jgi:dihydroorotate dehydrogenase electron transfer subunit
VKRVRAEILNSRRLGAYHTISLVAPEVSEHARSGQLVSVAMPGDRSQLLRRTFPIAQASHRAGWTGTIEFVFDPEVSGNRWLAEARAHQFLDVIGPVGKAFAVPRKLTGCLLVSEEESSAPMYFLAEELRAHGKRVDMVVGGRDREHVYKPIEAKRLSQTATIVTEDGSVGERGRVVEAVPATVESSGAQVIYAMAPRPTLRSVAELCAERRIPSQVAVDEPIVCATGLCFTCVVPVIRKDGTGFDHLRACVEGPVFNAARILWDRWMGEDGRLAPTPPEGFPVVRTWPG